MSADDFVLSARLDGVARADAMVAALADAVLRQAGVEPAAMAATIRALLDHVRDAAAHGGSLEVTFRGSGGALEVDVVRPAAAGYHRTLRIR